MLTGDAVGRSGRNGRGRGATGTPRERRPTTGPGKCRGRDNTDLQSLGQGEITRTRRSPRRITACPVEAWDDPEPTAKNAAEGLRRVIPPLAPGVAAEDPPNALRRTPDHPVLPQRFGEILAARRLVAAVRTDPRADQKLISADQENQQTANKQARQPQDASRGTRLRWPMG